MKIRVAKKIFCKRGSRRRGTMDRACKRMRQYGLKLRVSDMPEIYIPRAMLLWGAA